MTKRLSRNNIVNVTPNVIVCRYLNKTLKSGRKKNIKNLFFKIQSVFFKYNTYNSIKFFLWDRINYFLNPLEIKTWEPTRKRQGKIATTMKKKLKEKLKKFNTLLAFPVRNKKQYTKVLSILRKHTKLTKTANKATMKKNMHKRLLASLLKLVNIETSRPYKINMRQLAYATNIKITSITKSKRWH